MDKPMIGKFRKLLPPHNKLSASLGGDAGEAISSAASSTFLKIAIAILLAGSAASLLALHVVAPDQTARAMAPVVVSCIAMMGWHFLRRGWIQASRNVLAFGPWSAVTVAAIFTDGVRAPVVIAYPVIILMVAWMISARATLVVTGLTVAATVGLVVAEAMGVLPKSLPSSPIMHGGDQIVIYLLSAAMAVFLVRAYQSRLRELHQAGARLSEHAHDLEASKAELQRAQAVAKVGNWIYEIATDTLRLSAETCRILGLPDGTTGNYERYLAQVHAQDRDAVERIWQRACDGEVFDCEHRIVMGDALRWVRQKAEPEFAPDGSVLRVVGITQDISDRKNAETQLRIAATAFESHEGMAITDAQKVILQVNQAFTEITGYGAQEVVGQSPHMLNSGRHDAAFYAMMWSAIALTGSWQGEIWNRRKNGEVYPEWLTITAVKDEAAQVTHYVAIFSDITARKTAESKIQSLAFFDPLTRLPNRRLLIDRLKQAQVANLRYQRQGALLFVDLDDFKTLNDTLGHAKGDLLLQQVARSLLTCVREGDTVARLGGDEFVVMLEDLSDNALEAATQAESVGEKLLIKLNQMYQLATDKYHSTSSIGVTLFGDSKDNESVEEPVKRAELAMYQAKAAGRNTLRFYDPQMQAEVTARATLEMDVREALEKHEFLLYYQAQVTAERQLTGVEALLRWQHPKRGLVSPDQFITLAEKTGLILPLGHWVLETACTQLVQWAQHPALADLTLAVNVSARQFHQRDFVDQVLAVLERTGANPGRLKIELTESLLISNVEDVIVKMNSLKAAGVGFSLDDFGTGFSSLSYLKRLPLDQLKIDQGFVKNILWDTNDAAIAKMVVALADSLGLVVIAEGVETEAQRHFLADLGCSTYQGYLFGRPLPLAEFEALCGEFAASAFLQ
jgi:diguanylate cyclase (GGDEF)-like protein/PAS domain S-box-containing protein